MPPWIASYFLNSAFLLPGAALLSIPVIIHLINRLRYRRVKWAAMEFLLESQQKNRRRLLLEQLLLLLMRMLAVAGIVALIARPMVDPQKWTMFQGQRVHHLVLLDDSTSMRDHWGDTTAFSQGIDVIRKIVAEGARRPGTQSFSLMLLSNPSQPVYIMRALDPAFEAEILSKLDTLKCSHRKLDVVAGLQASQKLLVEQPGSARNFHFISDYRQSDWDQDTSLPQIIADMRTAKIAVNLVKTVPARHENVAITDMTAAVEIATVNVPVPVEVEVTNFSEKVAKDVSLTFVVDGNKLPSNKVIPSLEPGRKTTVQESVSFATTGWHDVKVLLPADSFEYDNDRSLVFHIADQHQVLIVDGDSQPSGSSAAGSHAYYVSDALSPEPGLTGIATSVVGTDFLRRHPLDPYQCIYLLNVGELPADTVNILEEYVKQGGGLAWYLGDQVKIPFYNDVLYDRGRGLFPTKLGGVSELAVDQVNQSPDMIFTPHPMFLNWAAEEDSTLLKVVHVTKYFSVQADDDKGDKRSAGTVSSGSTSTAGNGKNGGAEDAARKNVVQVIASLRNKAPLFLEHQFGKGRVITCLTSCNPQWTNWPRDKYWVVLQLQLRKYIARKSRGLNVRTVGEPIPLELDAAAFSPIVEIVLPDGTTERITAVLGSESSTSPDATSKAAADKSPSSAADGSKADGAKADAAKANAPASDQGADSVTSSAGSSRFVDTFTKTDLPGVYTIKLKRVDGTDEIRKLSYHIASTEGLLELTTNERIRERLGPNVAVQIQEPGQFEWLRGEQSGQELHDIVLLTLLMILMGEQLLALKQNYHSSRAGARV